MRARAVVACLALLPAGCVLKHSAPARLYVLQALAREPAAPAGDAPRGVLGVLRVSVPAWMDRPEITARTGSPNGSRPTFPTVQRPNVNLCSGRGV